MDVLLGLYQYKLLSPGIVRLLSPHIHKISFTIRIFRTTNSLLFKRSRFLQMKFGFRFNFIVFLWEKNEKITLDEILLCLVVLARSNVRKIRNKQHTKRIWWSRIYVLLPDGWPDLCVVILHLTLQSIHRTCQTQKAKLKWCFFPFLCGVPDYYLQAEFKC